MNRAHVILGILTLLSCDSSNQGRLLGPDLDNDGVRDDVGKWIDSRKLNENSKSALKQYAKYLRLSLIDVKNSKLSIDNSYKVSKASDCFYMLMRDTHEHVTQRMNEYSNQRRIIFKTQEINLKKINEKFKIKSKKWRQAKQIALISIKELDQKYSLVAKEYSLKSKEKYKYTEDVFDKTFDTREKLNLYHVYDRQLGGQFYTSFQEVADACEFKIEKDEK